MLKHLRLIFSFAKFSLIGELAFRSNFLLKILVELIWLGILLTFFRTIFGKTSNVAGWSDNEFLFFVGIYYALEGFVETFFLENCVEFSELVRSGNLDFCLLKPIDPQFFITLRRVDWSTAPKMVLGFIMVVIAVLEIGQPIEPWKIPVFFSLFLCGCSLAYSFLLFLTSLSVWMIRNQSLMEVWWLFTNLMRYPRQIYDSELALPIRLVFGFVIPALLAVSIPVEFAVKKVSTELVLFMIFISVVYFLISRMFFNYSLKHYRSASS
jgi:ABC-2 type transport system permease protein